MVGVAVWRRGHDCLLDEGQAHVPSEVEKRKAEGHHTVHHHENIAQVPLRRLWRYTVYTRRNISIVFVCTTVLLYDLRIVSINQVQINKSQDRFGEQQQQNHEVLSPISGSNNDDQLE